MTLMLFVGCAFTAYGAVIPMLVLTVFDDPIKIIILVISAFCWLLSLVCSSIVWLIFPLKQFILIHIVASVIIQEVFRYFTHRLLHYMKTTMTTVSGIHEHVFPHNRVVAYVCGLGFGTISGLFSYMNILSSTSGPGTTGLYGDSDWFPVISAVFTFCFTLLHVAWSLISFSALSDLGTFGLKYTVATHLLASCATLSNMYKYYVVSLITIIPLTFITLLFGFVAAGGIIGNLILVLTFRKPDIQNTVQVQINT